MNVLEEVKKIEREIIQWRRDLHKIPELNLYLPKTTKYVEEKLKEMGIAEEVFEEYNKRYEFADVEKYLVKDGSICGYLFRCLHCKKYHLYVDAD